MRKHEATHGPPDEDDSSEEVSQLSDIFASDGSSEGDAANEEGEGMERDEEEGQYDSSDQKRNISARSNAGSREESQSTPNWNAPSPNFRRPGRGVSRFSR